ncbi:prepilin-type N-terminal cleavage/methylation domain-containing protein [Candidatus Riflebacteria bacterium]
MRGKRLGFTIIELLIVVIIIGILSAAGVGKYASFATEARVAVCLSNQKQITSGMGIWQTKKVAIPSNGNYKGGGWHIWFGGQNGYGYGRSLPARVRMAWDADRWAVKNIVNDANLFRCPENTARRPQPRGYGASGSNSTSYNIYYWFRDYYNGGWTPPGNDSPYTTCYCWGYNNGVWPDGTRTTQHMAGYAN